MWISSYCIACIYQQLTKVMQMFCPLSEGSYSPAKKHTKHIHGVNNLVEKLTM